MQLQTAAQASKQCAERHHVLVDFNEYPKMDIGMPDPRFRRTIFLLHRVRIKMTGLLEHLNPSHPSRMSVGVYTNFPGKRHGSRRPILQ